MRNFYKVAGYWKDDKSEFYDYIVTDYDDAPSDGGILEDDIFFFGLSEEEIKNCISEGEAGILDFVITSYEKCVG